MAAAPLRILILEDVPMDAELVEYELRRSRIPFDAHCVDTRDGFERELDEFRPGSVNEETAVGCMKAGAEARHGVDALRQLEFHSEVDLVGGRELGRRLASLRPSLPVLIISGYTEEDVTQRGLLEPGAPFQQKPFAPEELARKVREMLDAARARTPASCG